MKNQRILWIDITKGIAILLTIVGHTVRGNLRGLIFSFHMPLFLILAGYTLSRKKKPLLSSLKQDFARLIFPVFVVCFLRLLLKALLNPEHFADLFQTAVLSLLWGNGCAYGTLPGIGAVWFFIDLFLAKQLYRLICNKIIRHRLLFVCILAFAGIILGEKVWLPQSLDLVFVSLLFLEVGSILRDLEERSFPWLPAVGCFSALIWIYLTYTNGIYIEMAMRYYPQSVLCLLAAVAGSICAIQISQSLESFSTLSRTLAFLGQNSLLLLCIHDLDSIFSRFWNLTFLEEWNIVQLPTVFASSSVIISVVRIGFDICVLLLFLGLTHLIRKLRITASSFSSST